MKKRVFSFINDYKNNILINKIKLQKEKKEFYSKKNRRFVKYNRKIKK